MKTMAILHPEIECMSREEIKKLQSENNFTELMCLQEEIKTAPFGDIWAEYLVREGVETAYLPQIKEYEEKVLVKRV